MFQGDGKRVFGAITVEQLPVRVFSGTLNDLRLDFDSLSITIDRPPQGWEVVRPLQVEARVHVDQGIGGSIDATIDASTWLAGVAVGQSEIHIRICR